MNDQNNNGVEDVIDTDRAKSELEHDRAKWKTRRKLANLSFGCLLAFGIYYSLVGIFIDEAQARSISQFNGIVVAIIGAFSTIMVGYFGTSYLYDKDNIQNKKQ